MARPTKTPRDISEPKLDVSGTKGTHEKIIDVEPESFKSRGSENVHSKNQSSARSHFEQSDINHLTKQVTMAARMSAFNLLLIILVAFVALVSIYIFYVFNSKINSLKNELTNLPVASLSPKNLDLSPLQDTVKSLVNKIDALENTLGHINPDSNKMLIEQTQKLMETLQKPISAESAPDTQTQLALEKLNAQLNELLKSNQNLIAETNEIKLKVQNSQHQTDVTLLVSFQRLEETIFSGSTYLPQLERLKLVLPFDDSLKAPIEELTKLGSQGVWTKAHFLKTLKDLTLKDNTNPAKAQPEQSFWNKIKSELLSFVKVKKLDEKGFEVHQGITLSKLEDLIESHNFEQALKSLPAMSFQVDRNYKKWKNALVNKVLVEKNLQILETYVNNKLTKS